MRGVYENNGRGSTKKMYAGFTKRGSTKICYLIQAGQRKFTAIGGGVYQKFPSFDRFRPIPPPILNEDSL